METPCINICSLDPVDGLCDGCYRTIEEIMAWSGYSSQQRRRIMDDLPQRSAARDTMSGEETVCA
ncbi:DUF1289 domain-containing protein [Rhizobium sp. Leaf311]|uniref:DUF1289 domain-containing protein n=1 Tax=Rhizobium sp. Leaf311 TaxID=1736332 RepID=UPI0009EAB13F|nr:DUF1289 domain-containing protein [Rhizobium sp. Leaf311]